MTLSLKQTLALAAGALSSATACGTGSRSFSESSTPNSYATSACWSTDPNYCTGGQPAYARVERAPRYYPQQYPQARPAPTSNNNGNWNNNQPRQTTTANPTATSTSTSNPQQNTTVIVNVPNGNGAPTSTGPVTQAPATAPAAQRPTYTSRSPGMGRARNW